MKASQGNVILVSSIIFTLISSQRRPSLGVSAGKLSRWSFEGLEGGRAKADWLLEGVGQPASQLEVAEKTEETTGEPEEAEETCGYPFYRLPGDVRPKHYELTVAANLESGRYEGALEVSLEVARQTSTLVLQAADFEIHQLHLLERLQTLNNRTGRRESRFVPLESVCRSESAELLVLRLGRPLEPSSEASLNVSFSGEIAEHNHRGFYKSSYFNLNASSRRYHALTQFQATEARRVFPCWDEPAFKATFNLSLLVTPADRLVMSNTLPIWERRLESPAGQSRKLVRFRETPPMSSYLLAFVVGEFEYLERLVSRRTGGPVRLRVYTPLERQSEGQFALDCAARALGALERFFEIPYALQKLDLVSVPDFEAGAMENWGLVTFKAQQLLVSSRDSTQELRALVASTIVHELAHQWFGNLVTMSWWDDLWLNEGFATWLEYELSAELFPEMDFQLYYLINSHIRALDEDSHRQTHAVEPQRELSEDDQIDHLFDAISYNKAAAVIRLLEESYREAEQPEAFASMLRLYIRSHQFNSTDLGALLESIRTNSSVGEASASRRRQLLESWIKQPGHPMLSVRYERLGNQLYVQQERFLTGTWSLNEFERNQSWLVPLSILLSSANGQRQEVFRTHVSEPRSLIVNLPEWFARDQASWLKLNHNFSGFYRVSYQAEMFRALQSAVSAKLMGESDRLNLVDDAHTLLLADKIRASRLLKLLSCFSEESSGAVIQVLVGSFEALLKLYHSHELIAEPLLEFGRKLFAKLYANNYSKMEPHTSPERLSDNLGRSALLSILVRLDHKQTVEEALEMFRSHASRFENALDPNLREPVYEAVARSGADREHARLFQMFADTLDRPERRRLASGILRSHSRKRLEAAWSWLLELAEREESEQRENKHKLVLLEEKLGLLGSGFSASESGRELLLELLEGSQLELSRLADREEGLASLLEELGQSMGSEKEFSLKTSRLLRQHRREWSASASFVRRLLNWQQVVARKGAAKTLALLSELNSGPF